METKYNQATPQRPEGTRPLDADLIPIDLLKCIDQIKNEQAYAHNGKNALTVFKSNTVTITLIALKANEHIHPGNNEDIAVMTLQVLKGSLSFDNQIDRVDLAEGQLVTLHQKLAFDAIALQESICLLTLVKQ
jgi:hypothetical protein